MKTTRKIFQGLWKHFPLTVKSILLQLNPFYLPDIVKEWKIYLNCWNWNKIFIQNFVTVIIEVHHNRNKLMLLGVLKSQLCRLQPRRIASRDLIAYQDELHFAMTLRQKQTSRCVGFGCLGMATKSHWSCMRTTAASGMQNTVFRAEWHLFQRVIEICYATALSVTLEITSIIFFNYYFNYLVFRCQFRSWSYPAKPPQA